MEWPQIFPAARSGTSFLRTDCVRPEAIHDSRAKPRRRSRGARLQKRATGAPAPAAPPLAAALACMLLSP